MTTISLLCLQHVEEKQAVCQLEGAVNNPKVVQLTPLLEASSHFSAIEKNAKWKTQLDS